MSEQVRLGSENRAPAGSAALLVLAVALALTASPPALAAAPIAATSDDTQSSAPQPGLLARLLRLDPGARLGANTHVATASKAVLVGVPGRVNFMIGLGPRQRIMGGAEHDQLGARGAGSLVRGGRGNDLIHGHHGRQVLTGGRGHDHIFGGRGRDRLHGGPGNDRLVDHQGATVVITGPGLNRVDVADGDRDERVVCTPGSINRIRADRGDRLHPRCRRATSSISYARPASKAPAARVAQQQPVSGAGTHDNPYTAACDDETKNPCEISAFAARSLTGFWTNEYVPAYKCPTSHPYLYKDEYGPTGSDLLGGVEVAGLGPVGVSITGFFSVDLDTVWRITGADTGFTNSSATNWTTGTNSYQVKLHCTKTASLGFGGPR